MTPAEWNIYAKIEIVGNSTILILIEFAFNNGKDKKNDYNCI